MAVFDYRLMFMSSGNLTKTSTVPAAGLKIRGTGIKGAAARVVFPTTPGLSAQVLPTVLASDDDSTYHTIASYPGGALSWESGGKEVYIPFTTDKKYVKMTFTVTGGSTATSFGAVKAGVVEGVGYDWDRSVSFE